MKKTLITLACITSIIASPTLFAASVSGSLGVQLTITNGCAINGDPAPTSSTQIGSLDFGSHGTLVGLITGTSTGAGGTGTIQIQCTNLLPYNVTLNNGLNATGTQRRLANSTNYVQYNLYQDPTRLILWDSATPMNKVATGLTDTLNVYGTVPPQATPAAGTYNDTVIVTVNW